MRRIAVVAMTAVVLGAGIGLTAVPASAAPAEERAAAKRWSTFDGKKGSIWRTIKSDGTYTRSGGKITIRGWIRDTGKNGWSPAVQFRVWRDGRWHTSAVYYVKYRNSGKVVDQRFNFNYGHFWTTKGSKLQVREVAYKVSTNKPAKRAAWKKIF